MIHSSVLVLNRSYLPVQLTSAKRAFALVYRGVAKALREDFQTLKFGELLVENPPEGSEVIGTVGGPILVPRVIVLESFDRVPRRPVRFSRGNVLARDGYTCQYCGKTFPKTQLNLDHVIPRTLGGKTSWGNVVASCFPCNHRKGGRTPEQARLRLLRTPTRPRWTNSFQGKVRYKQWQPFLRVVEQRRMGVNYESTSG